MLPVCSTPLEAVAPLRWVPFLVFPLQTWLYLRSPFPQHFLSHSVLQSYFLRASRIPPSLFFSCWSCYGFSQDFLLGFPGATSLTVESWQFRCSFRFGVSWCQAFLWGWEVLPDCVSCRCHGIIRSPRTLKVECRAKRNVPNKFKKRRGPREKRALKHFKLVLFVLRPAGNRTHLKRRIMSGRYGF